MIENPNAHPLEHLVTDYLNGRLSSDAQQGFEQALAADQELKNVVEFERSIKQVIRRQERVATPDFQSLEQKLARRSAGLFGLRPAQLVPLAASFVLAIAIGFTSLYPSQVDDYHTLSSEAVTYERTVVRIITVTPLSDVEREQLYARYELRAAGEFPEANTIDVFVTGGASLASVADMISQDDRVLAARVIEAESRD